MKKQKILALLVATAMTLSAPQAAFAQQVSSANGPEYLEYHYQVNFDDLDVFLVNGTTLDISSRDRDVKIANDIDALTRSLSECSDIETEIIAMLNDNQQLAAISFTEAPLLFVDDHYERIMANDAVGYDSSTANGKGKFTMYTSVTRSYSANPDKTYDYTTKTMGSWSRNDAEGGSEYPDAGADYILQATPDPWVRKSHTMTARYDNSPINGSEGNEFWSLEGGENYLKYGIEDDPYDFAKARQNKNFALTCVSEGKTTTSARMINSYYVHTWTELSIEVSVTVNSLKEVGLSITPSINDMNWKVYNYITFNF